MKKRYLINSLTAAGFVISPIPLSAKLTDNVAKVHKVEKSIFNVMRRKIQHEVAGHRSHSSHASHRSSAGGSIRRTPVKRYPRVYTPQPALKAPTRNLQTTPKVSILPSTPAITQNTPSTAVANKIKKIIMEIQFALFAFGYYEGEIDGILGAGTKNALSKFQSDSNMKVTGTINAEVLKVLGVKTQ